MKKILILFGLNLMVYAAFAQHDFKPLKCIGQSSKFANGAIQSDMIKEDIIINTKDSTINITPAYGSARRLKMVDMADEKTLVYEDQRTLKYFQFHARDEKGKLWLVQLQRQTQPKTKNIMTLVVSDQAGEFTNYSCEYQKDI